MPSEVAPATSTDTYRRAARRLRCRLAGDPARMQRSLKALADRTPPATRGEAPGHDDSTFFEGPTGAAQRFADHLTANVTTGVLRYSQRLQLLRTARQLGIERFEANLLIAAVVDRRTRAEVAVGANDALVGNLVAFLVVQSAVLLGAWWTLFR